MREGETDRQRDGDSWLVGFYGINPVFAYTKSYISKRVVLRCHFNQARAYLFALDKMVSNIAISH